MSYIKHKDRVFRRRGSKESLNRTRKKATSVTGCPDPRAWALNDDDRRTFFIEAISNSTIEERFIPVDLIIDILLQQKNELIKELEEDKDKKRIFNEFLMKQGYENKASGGKMMVDISTNTICENEEEIGKGECEEFSNLKTLVKDLREQVLYLESVKKENLMLKMELQVDLKQELDRALVENNHLASQLDACQAIVDKYDDLKERNEELKKENKNLKRELDSVKDLNEDLNCRLKEEKDKLNEMKAKRAAVTTAVAEREILLSKLNNRDEKIAALSDLVEDQERQIHEITWHLQRLTSSYTQKEERLLDKLEDAKRAAANKYEKLEEYQTKLEGSERLIKELYTLRNQFRITNAGLYESKNYYKSQLDTLSEFSLKMAATVKELESEIFQRDVEIKKLSIFPQAGKTIVYFAQLNSLLNRDDVCCDSDPERVKELVSELKRIVTRLKLDVWEDEEEAPLRETREGGVQCRTDVRDAASQVEARRQEGKHVQTLPDERIESIEGAVMCLREEVISKREEFRLLEGKLLVCVQAKAACDAQISDLQRVNSSSKQMIQELLGELEESNELLERALDEIEADVSARESTSQLFDSTLGAALHEYLEYIETLESYIALAENNTEELHDHMSGELQEKQRIVQSLENNVQILGSALEAEKNKNAALSNQMIYLESTYLRKENAYNVIKEKLNNIDALIDEFEDFLVNLRRGDDGSLIPIEGSEESSHVRQIDRISRVLMQQNNLNNNQAVKIESLTTSNVALKRIVKNHRMKNKDLKQRVIQLKTNVRRVTKCVRKLHRALRLTEDGYRDLQVANRTLIEDNESLRGENRDLSERVARLGTNLRDLGETLEKRQEEDRERSEENEMLHRALNKVGKKLEKYRRVLVYEEEAKARDREQLELVRHDLVQAQRMNLGLTETVAELQRKVTNNTKVVSCSQVRLGDLVDYIDRPVQVEFEDVHEEKFKLIIKGLENEFEYKMAQLKRESAMEKEELNRQHVSNLAVIEQSYEKDIDRIRRTHAENMARMRAMHEEEVKHYEELRNVEVKNRQNCNLSIEALTREFENRIQELNKQHEADNNNEKEELEKLLKEEYDKGIRKLENEYADKLKSKEEKFSQDVIALKGQWDREVAEKDAELKSLREEMNSNMAGLKQKCKQYVQKCRERHRNNIERMKSEFVRKYEQQRSDELRKKKLDALTVTKTEQFEVLDSPVRERSSLENLTFRLKKELDVSSTLDDSIAKNLEATTKNILDMETKRIYHDLAPMKEDCAKALEVIPVKGSWDNEPLKSAYLWDKSYLLSRISELESELIMKNHEVEKNVKMLEKRVKEEHMKLAEVGSLLDFEMKHSAKVQQRLGSEFERAERLQSERDSLVRHTAMLERNTQQAAEAAEAERVTSRALKAQLEKAIDEQKDVRLLEASLARVRTKLGKAVESERRLSEELEKEREENEKLRRIVSVHDQALVQDTSLLETSRADMKVIFIEHCGVIHQWNKRVVEEIE